MNVGRTTPVLRIFDEAKAREFYLGYLGFTLTFEHRHAPGLPNYMGVARGDCLLHDRVRGHVRKGCGQSAADDRGKDRRRPGRHGKSAHFDDHGRRVAADLFFHCENVPAFLICISTPPEHPGAFYHGKALA